MKNRDEQTSLGYKQYNAAMVYQFTVAGLSSRLRITSGPIVHGNMHDPNSWSYTVNFQVEIKGKLDRFSLGVPYYQVGYYGANSPHPVPPTWDRTSMYNRALEKLNFKVRGNLDLGVALAESGSTYRMLKGVADLVRYAEDYVRRPKWKDGANLYLQWKYGWKPLCQDIFGAADEAIRQVFNELERVEARVSEPLPSSQNGVWSGVNGIPNVPFVRRTIGKQSCTFCLDLNISTQAFRLDRWTSLNPVSLAWELIPYSFVVDWVYDVGSYLRSLETALLYGTAFRAGYVSELFVADCIEAQPAPYTAANGHKATGCFSELRYRQFVRTKLSSYPLPRKPSFRVDLGASQLFSAAALLTQIFSKG